MKSFCLFVLIKSFCQILILADMGRDGGGGSKTNVIYGQPGKPKRDTSGQIVGK